MPKTKGIKGIRGTSLPTNTIVVIILILIILVVVLLFTTGTFREVFGKIGELLGIAKEGAGESLNNTP